MNKQVHKSPEKGEERRSRPTGLAYPSRQRNPQNRQTQLSSPSPQWVIRLINGKINQDTQPLTDLPIFWTENLEQAIEKIITLTKDI